MSVRARFVATAFVFGLAVVGTVAALDDPKPSVIPAPFDQLAQWCASFDRVSLAMTVGYSSDTFVLAWLAGDGRLAFDTSDNDQMWLPVHHAWTAGQVLTASTLESEAYFPRVEETPFLEAIFAECRAGFAHSAWEVVDTVGPPTARLLLPYAWAEPFTIEVETCSSTNPTPRTLKLTTGGRTTWVHIYELGWNASFSDDVFIPMAAADPLPVPRVWRHESEEECLPLTNDPDVRAEVRCRAKWQKLMDVCAAPGLTAPG